MFALYMYSLPDYYVVQKVTRSFKFLRHEMIEYVHVLSAPYLFEILMEQ